MKSTIRDRREVTSAELPHFIREGWKILSWGTWTAGAGFLIIIGRV